MSEIAVGSRVRVKASFETGYAYYAPGDTGTLLDFDGSGAWVLFDVDNHHVDARCKGQDWWCHLPDLELITPARVVLEVWKKDYDGESLYDLDRDISEAFQTAYNAKMAQVPVDEHGLHKGTFTVTVQWKDEDE